MSRSLDFDNIGEFIIENNKFFIKSKTHTLKGKIEVDGKVEGIDCNCFFDLTLINLINNIKSLLGEIEISISKETPLIIKGSNADVDFSFVLAARAE